MDATWLREARERADYPLGDLAEALQVRSSYLEALERGDLGKVLGPTYVQSILVRYAVCLHIDPEWALRTYERQAVPPSESVPRREQSSVRHESRRRAVLAITVIAGATVLGGALLLSSTMAGRPKDSAVAAPTAAVIARASPTSTPLVPTTTVSATTATTTVEGLGTPPVSQASADTFTVVLTPSAEVWLEITDQASGEVLFFGTKKANEKLSVELSGPAKAVVGKPEALSVTLDAKTVQGPHALVWQLASTGITAIQ